MRNNIVLNCTDDPVCCEYCGEEIPPNSDHECNAKCVAPTGEYEDQTLRDLLAKALDAANANARERDEYRDQAVAARAEIYRLKDGCARCGSPGPKAEETIWCAACLEWYREEWSQHSPCAQEGVLRAELEKERDRADTNHEALKRIKRKLEVTRLALEKAKAEAVAEFCEWYANNAAPENDRPWFKKYADVKRRYS